jgi:hypothetical protein
MTDIRLDRIAEGFGELRERFTGRVDLDALRQYDNDIIGFAEQVLKVRLWEPHQRDWVRAVQDHPQVVVVAGLGMGKEVASAVVLLHRAYVKRGTGLATSKTQRQVSEQLFSEIAKLVRAGELPGELFQTALRVPGGGRILGFTSDSSGSYHGFHDPNGVTVVLSEAQDIPAETWVALQGCAVGADDRILGIGNATVATGAFYDKFSKPGWRQFRVPCSEHPNLKSGTTIIAGGPTLEWLTRVKEDWGSGSPQYRARVEAAFLTEEADALGRRDWAEASIARWENTEPDMAEQLVVGVDFGLTGDRTILASVRGTRVCEIVQLPRAADSNLMNERIGDALDGLGVRPNHKEVHPAWLDGTARPTYYGPPEQYVWVGATGLVVADVNGVGDSCGAWLRREHYKTLGFNGSRNASQPKKWHRLRSEALWLLRKLSDDGTLAWPRDPLLIDEYLTIKWWVDSSGAIQVEPKEDLRKRLGRSPDRLDAVAMALWGSLRPAIPKQTAVHW